VQAYSVVRRPGSHICTDNQLTDGGEVAGPYAPAGSVLHPERELLPIYLFIYLQGLPRTENALMFQHRYPALQSTKHVLDQ
jgi:hypothetical protein